MKNEKTIINEIRQLTNQLKRIGIESDNDGVDRSESARTKLVIIETLK